MPIPVEKVLAVFSRLNEQTEKGDYAIEIKDSKYLEGQAADTKWEFFISINPEKMGGAAKILCELLNESNAPRVYLQLAAKKKIKDYPAGREARLCFYKPIDPGAALLFLQRISGALDQGGIRPNGANPKGSVQLPNSPSTPWIFYRRINQPLYSVLSDEKYDTLRNKEPITNDLRGGKFIRASYYKQCIDEGRGHPLFAEKNKDFFSKPFPQAMVQPTIESPELQKAIDVLSQSILTLSIYGAGLQGPVKSEEETKEYRKKSFIEKLTKDLQTAVNQFQNKRLTQQSYEELRTQFYNKLGPSNPGLSNKKALDVHRNDWMLPAVIVGNILFALTGIGALVLAANAAYVVLVTKQSLTLESGLFGARTTSRKLADEVESRFEDFCELHTQETSKCKT